MNHGRQGFENVTPQIVELEARTILGVLRPVGPDMSVGAIWQEDFGAHQGEIEAHNSDGLCYGVLVTSPDKTPDGIGQYLAGMAVGAWDGESDAVVARELPAGTYVRFDFTFDQQCKGGPEFAFDWVRGSTWQHSPEIGIHDFALFGEAGEVSFHIPVRPRAEAQP